MNNLKKLLDLISQGDAAQILAEEKLTAEFNELLKHELIDTKNGRVFLTAKGEELINNKLSHQLRLENEMAVFSTARQKTWTVIFYICLATSIISLLMLLFFYQRL